MIEILCPRKIGGTRTQFSILKSVLSPHICYTTWATSMLKRGKLLVHKLLMKKLVSMKKNFWCREYGKGAKDVKYVSDETQGA